MGMDRNDNQAIIRKLAKRDQKRNWMRNLLVCVTIACAAALMFAFILYLFGTQEEKLRILENSPQVSYQEITMEQAKQLKQDERVRWIGLEVFVGRGKVGNTRLSVSWQDQAFMEREGIAYTGTLPAGKKEIMIPQEYLKKTGNADAMPGDAISMDLGDGTVREYRIAAVSTNLSRVENSQHIYVSLPCAMMLKGSLKEEDIRISASIMMKNALDFDKKEAEQQAGRIAEDAGISEEQRKFNESYYMQAGLARLTTEDIVTLVIVVLLIMMGSYFVIHNIFYLSVVEKVREYGQMRTVGMTKKQVKRLILWEGIGLAFKGSIWGLFPGGCMGFFLVPGGFSVSHAAAAAVFCILLSVLFVGVSIRVPGKIAAEASPIAAASYTGYEKKGSRNISNDLTPKYLADLNLRRNRKKAVWTMISLVLAGILIGTIASYVISYDPAASVTYAFPEGEYQLTLNPSLGFGSDTSLDGRMKLYSVLQAEEVMGEELSEELKNLKYVTQVKPWRYLTVSTTLFQKEGTEIGLNGISEHDFEMLREMPYEGTDSYQELLRRPGLIIVNEYYESLRKKPLAVGDTVPVVFYDGKGQRREEMLPVLAVVKVTSWQQKNRTARLPLSLMGSGFMMPDSVMDQWAGMNTTYGYEISVEQKNEKAAGVILEEMYGMEKELYLASKAENREYYEKQFFSTKIILYALTVFLVIFGIINLTNTILTNLYSRRKEFGILQAVGMTQRQLKDMLSRENLYYTGISSGCTLVFGSILGYALVMVEIQMGVDMVYSYPWMPIVFYILLMFFMQKCLTDYGVKLLQKQSLADRMRIE